MNQGDLDRSLCLLSTRREANVPVQRPLTVRQRYLPVPLPPVATASDADRGQEQGARAVLAQARWGGGDAGGGGGTAGGAADTGVVAAAFVNNILAIWRSNWAKRSLAR